MGKKPEKKVGDVSFLEWKFLVSIFFPSEWLSRSDFYRCFMQMSKYRFPIFGANFNDVRRWGYKPQLTW